MKTYSTDLRQKVIDAYKNGEGSLRVIAKRFSVSLNFVWSLWARYKQTGSVEPKPHGGGRAPTIDTKGLEVLRQLVHQHSDATLVELRERFVRKTNIEVSVSAISRALKKLNITRKKKTFHASERDHDPKVQQEREEFEQGMPDMDPEQLVFIDESGIHLGMARHYARAPAGQRAHGAKPTHPKNISLITVLSLHGVIAALLIPHPVDGEVFKGFIENILVPVLEPGDRVLMDNLKAHQVKGVEQLINEGGATVQFLPPYSPDFSPIENSFSKVKEELRRIGAKTFRSLIKGVKDALNEVSEKDAQGWFANCGYCIAPE
jgi:transposase